MFSLTSFVDMRFDETDIDKLDEISAFDDENDEFGSEDEEDDTDMDDEEE